MTAKDCGHHNDEKKERLKKILAGVLVVIVIILLVILIVWAVLKPTKPKFLLQDATVYGFNVTGPTLTSVFQVTVQAKNSNDKIAIYYDRLISYATYDDQQITLRTAIPPTYQDSNGMNIWSPFLTGQAVPIAPYIGVAINQDRSMGGVQIVIKLDGRIRFRVGSFTSGTYSIHVTCPAIIPFGDSGAGVYLGNNAVKYQLVQSCSVSV